MKNYNILLIYDTLVSGESVSRSEFCVSQNISERTFYRYMREIMCFIKNRRPAFVIDVKEPSGVYYLKEAER